MSGEVLAADAGIDRAYESEIENAAANPTIDMLEKLAGVLGVELAEFFIVPDADEEPPKPLRAGRRPKN
jgi:transcriptional regulator with XRE-family HTH domain